jgi:hypothetical protein
MKKELNNEYDIDVRNMNDIVEEIGGFKITDGKFMIPTKKYDPDNFLIKKILVKECTGGDSHHLEQIFLMKDGKFILEVDNGETCEYFYSENLKDLI